MPSLKDWLSRFQFNSEKQQLFTSWPTETPSIRAVPFDRLKDIPELGRASKYKPEPEKYDPAIIIAMGTVGETVLCQWSEQIAQDVSDSQNSLQAILITKTSVANIPTDRLSIRQINLASQAIPTQNNVSLETQRHEARRLFMEVENFKLFQNHLRIFLTKLHKNIRVIIIASLAEPEIGFLGDVLQVLHLQAQGRANNPFLNVTALLTLETPQSRLDDGEIYAALREVGRFSFSGTHWMEAPPGERTGVINKALLDHLFIVEAPTDAKPGMNNASFNNGVGQAMAETLFVFLHPSSRPLWENLANDVSQSGAIRVRTHEPVVYSLGIATLLVPLTEFRDYIAARLAKAALYGEGADFKGEGLISSNDGPYTLHTAEWIAKRWLEEGPYKHPLFKWLLEANGPATLRAVPNLAKEFVDVFRAQLAYGLARLLNDQTETHPLEQARITLEWLTKHFRQLDGWFKEASATTQSTPERLSFQFLLNQWHHTIAALNEQIKAWENTLIPQSAGQPEHDKEDSATNIVRMSWRDNAKADRWRSTETETAVSHPPSFEAEWNSLAEYLEKQYLDAERALTSAAGGEARRALTADAQRGLSEVQNYYTESVRPELSRHGLENSRAFKRVRERLGWWVNLQPGREPQLFLICVPPHIPNTMEGSIPPEAARFTPEDVDGIGQALLTLGTIQARGLEDDLTGSWLRRRADELKPFLTRADTPLLNYSLQQVVDSPYATSNRAYLIGRNKALTSAYKTTTFPNNLSRDINELDNNHAGRLTALKLWLNIPLTAMRSAERTYDAYHHQERLHLYPQESTAARYERRMRSVLGKKRFTLPPTFTLALAHPRLVTLFCQALFCQLIDIRRDEFNQNPEWALLPLDHSFRPLPLAAADDPLGLWHAFRKFTLELPNDPRIQQNPANHFHRERREQFLNSLLAKTRANRQQPDFKEQCNHVQHTVLKQLQQLGEKGDNIAHAFASLLLAEIDEPVWKEW